MSAVEKLRRSTISVLPGTGNMGSLFVEKFALAGLSVVLGSRDKLKAEKAAAEVSERTKHPVKGLPLYEAAAAGDVIFWTASGTLAEREALLKSLAKPLEGKVIIDNTNILFEHDDESAWGQTSSTLLNAKALGVPARWTTAFKNTFAKTILNPPDVNNPHSILVSGDDEEAVDITIALVESIPGFKGTKAGPLKYTKIVELLSSKWILVLDKLNAEGIFRIGYRIGQ